MNAAFAALLAERDFESEIDGTKEHQPPGEKFRMARTHHAAEKRSRPKQHNGMHRRRRKKIRL